jgi:GNAT superfamily N-acetyltransferase
MFEIIDTTRSSLPIRDRGAALLAGEALHRELRPALHADYLAQLDQMFGEGARIVHLVDEGVPCALAVWRLFHTTYCGRRLEVEDLVTASAARSRGHGATLLAWLEARARAEGCQTITLHSATHRDRAHRFYVRERFSILGYHFSKPV